MVDTLSLKKLKLNENKILEFGFSKVDSKLVLNKPIMNNEFLLNIQIENNVITSSVVEVDVNEKFVLYDVQGEKGSFVAQMRNEYNTIIENVISNCCEQEVFKTNQAHKIKEYVSKKYNSELEFMWKGVSDNAVLRNSINNKWYGVFIFVNATKLGLDKNEIVEIINLMVDPQNIDNVVNGVNIFKGFHMNKLHWISVLLDGGVSDNKLFELIDNSFELSILKNKSKGKRKWK